MWFTIGFGAACALGCYFWPGKWALLMAALVCGAGIGLPFLLDAKVGKRAEMVCMGLAVGLVWFFGYDIMYTAPVRELDGDVVDFELTTYQYSWKTDYGCAVDCYLDLDGKRYKVRLYLNEQQELEPWTTIESPVLVRLTTDGGRNEPTYHRSNGILALCYQRSEPEYSVRDDSAEGFLVIAVASIRRQLTEIIDQCFPGNTAAFAKALLLGDRTDMSYEMSTDFKVSGISHIVAVSGLHVSILFALIYVLTFKRRWLLAVLGIPVVILFMAVACFTPSVTRAGIMQILIILALCLNREYDPPTALAFAALAMLAVNPLVASSVGFQLSVGSVAGIFLFSGAIRNWILLRLPEQKHKICRGLRSWFAGSVSVTLSAQVITTPLVAVYFGTVSLIGVVTNLAVLWVITFIFYGVMGVCLLGFFSLTVANWAAWVIAWPIRYVIWMAKVFASVPLAAVYTESSYIVIWLVLCYGMILALIFGKGKRPLVCLCVGVLCLAMALGLSWLEPALYDHRVTVVDVGQGQSIILQHRGKTFLVDCGGDYANDAADSAAEILLSMGIQRIDGLILTHYDADHAGGVEYLLHRIDTGALYLPASDEDAAAPVIDAADDAEVVWIEEDLLLQSGGMKITLFAPEGAQNSNESSVAVLFQTEKCDTLITGDMSQFRERLLLYRTDLPELELLIVGHHGSKNSTSVELLEAASPEVAVISVGENNRYGHPAQETMERLEAAGCRVYRTDLSGDIIFRR